MAASVTVPSSCQVVSTLPGPGAGPGLCCRWRPGPVRPGPGLPVLRPWLVGGGFGQFSLFFGDASLFLGVGLAGGQRPGLPFRHDCCSLGGGGHFGGGRLSPHSRCAGYSAAIGYSPSLGNPGLLPEPAHCGNHKYGCQEGRGQKECAAAGLGLLCLALGVEGRHFCGLGQFSLTGRFFLLPRPPEYGLRWPRSARPRKRWPRPLRRCRAGPASVGPRPVPPDRADPRLGPILPSAGPWFPAAAGSARRCGGRRSSPAAAPSRR